VTNDDQLREAMLASAIDLAEKASEAGGHVAAEAYAKAARDIAEAYAAIRRTGTGAA
jgi:hypothetical protein